jgi:DNA-binding MarR family transcriptional regulator
MRRINEVAILRELRVHGPLSRVELTAALSLDAKTITNLTRDLLKRRFVEEGDTIAAGRRTDWPYVLVDSKTLMSKLDISPDC